MSLFRFSVLLFFVSAAAQISAEAADRKKVEIYTDNEDDGLTGRLSIALVKALPKEFKLASDHAEGTEYISITNVRMRTGSATVTADILFSRSYTARTPREKFRVGCPGEKLSICAGNIVRFLQHDAR